MIFNNAMICPYNEIGVNWIIFASRYLLFKRTKHWVIFYELYESR